jgi:hypothetical protein
MFASPFSFSILQHFPHQTTGQTDLAERQRKAERFSHKERSAAKPQPISWAFRCLNTVGSQGRCAEFYLLKGATALKRVL